MQFFSLSASSTSIISLFQSDSIRFQSAIYLNLVSTVEFNFTVEFTYSLKHMHIFNDTAGQWYGASGHQAFGAVVLEGGESLGADHMLDAAGVALGDLLAHAPVHQHLRHETVTLIDRFGDGASAFRQVDIAGIGDGDMVFLAQIFHRNGNTGFFEAHLVGDIHAAYDGEPAAQDQYRFQIVFRGFCGFTGIFGISHDYAFFLIFVAFI